MTTLDVPTTSKMNNSFAYYDYYEGEDGVSEITMFTMAAPVMIQRETSPPFSTPSRPSTTTINNDDPQVLHLQRPDAETSMVSMAEAPFRPRYEDDDDEEEEEEQEEEVWMIQPASIDHPEEGKIHVMKLSRQPSAASILPPPLPSRGNRSDTPSGSPPPPPPPPVPEPSSPPFDDLDPETSILTFLPMTLVHESPHEDDDTASRSSSAHHSTISKSTATTSSSMSVASRNLMAGISNTPTTTKSQRRTESKPQPPKTTRPTLPVTTAAEGYSYTYLGKDYSLFDLNLGEDEDYHKNKKKIVQNKKKEKIKDSVAPTYIFHDPPGQDDLQNDDSEALLLPVAEAGALTAQKLKNMKKRRVRFQRALAVGGTVAGFVVMGPVGAAVAGGGSYLITKTAGKAREKQYKQRQDKKKQQQQQQQQRQEKQ